MIAFARTIRALDADDFRGSMLALLLAAILLAAWTWWFFTPTIPSTMSETVTLHWDPTGHRATIRNLNPETFGRLRQDPPVRLHVGDQTISARVIWLALLKLPYDVSSVMLDVPATITPPLPSHATIEIETARVSPATIVLRALNR